jgi:hypothetical protein
LIDEVKSKILCSTENEWKSIIKNHILSKRPSELGASAVDIYLVAYVAVTFGPGKSVFFKYIRDAEISGEEIQPRLYGRLVKVTSVSGYSQ